jgi:hypothetical protein
MRGRNQVLKIFFTYPLTWLAVIVTIGMEWAFIKWFHPPLLMTFMLFGLGIVMLAVWPLVFLKSQAFRQRYNQMPYETDLKELEKTLAACSESFRKPAQECLVLLDKIRQEFQAPMFQDELDRIFRNLFDLSRNHVQLYSRTQQFGTAQQKQTMQNILKQQVRSVENSLTALKAFSGNLTLLDTHPEEYEGMGNNLKAINQELQNVIQEV